MVRVCTVLMWTHTFWADWVANTVQPYVLLQLLEFLRLLQSSATSPMRCTRSRRIYIGEAGGPGPLGTKMVLFDADLMEHLENKKWSSPGWNQLALQWLPVRPGANGVDVSAQQGCLVFKRAHLSFRSAHDCLDPTCVLFQRVSEL